MTTEQFVDLEVSRRKFDREIGRFRENEIDYRRRGILLVEATFPRAIVALLATHIPFSPLLFALRIDFANYDTWPPSVAFIDAFTGDALKPEQLPNLIPIGKPIRVAGDGVQAEAVMGQPLVQFYPDHPEYPPFLCHRGIREYHSNPAHSGDEWPLYRGHGEGTLARIVELVHKYGVAAAKPGFQVQVRVGYPVQEPAT